MEFQVLDVRVYDALPPPRFGDSLQTVGGEQWPVRAKEARDKERESALDDQGRPTGGGIRPEGCSVAVFGRGDDGDACLLVHGFRPHFVVDVLGDVDDTLGLSLSECTARFGRAFMDVQLDAARQTAELLCGGYGTRTEGGKPPMRRERASVLVRWEEVYDLHGATLDDTGAHRLPRLVVRVYTKSRKAYNQARWADLPVGVTWARCPPGTAANANYASLSEALGRALSTASNAQGAIREAVHLTRSAFQKANVASLLERGHLSARTRVAATVSGGAAGVVLRPVMASVHDLRPSLECKFSVASRVHPAQWLRIDKGRGGVTEVADEGLKRSWCTREFEVTMSPPPGSDTAAAGAGPPLDGVRVLDRDDVAPNVMCSMDIECLSRPGEFPRADVAEDEVCSVALSLWRHGHEDEVRRVGIISKPCDDVEGAEVLCVPNESALLLRMRDVLVEAGVDVVASWNGLQFDWRYVMDRAHHNNVGEDMQYMSKMCFDRGREVKDKPLASAGMGDQRLSWYAMAGRSNFDAYLWYKSNYKRAYNDLGSVCQEHIGDTKDDFPYALIGPSYHGTNEQRARLLRYNIKDTSVLCPLMSTLCCWVDQVEQSRVSCVCVERLTTHGQGIKVVSQAAVKGASMANRPFIFNEHHQTGTRSLVRRGDGDADDGGEDGGGADDDVAYEGATVIPPVLGIHELVVVNDFSSLYPSVMISNNVCISTIVKSAAGTARCADRSLAVSDLHEGHEYSASCPGVLPTMLQDILAERKAAKKKKANLEDVRDAATGPDDPEVEREGGMQKLKARIVVLDRRQLALKISANSVYGYLGSQTSFGDTNVAATVTGIGRGMLQAAIACGERCSRDLKRRDGEPVGTFRLVYGDTDSIMYSLSNVKTPRDGADVGIAVGNAVTALFKRPNKLEFEKCFAPMLLFNKKRYAGLMYEEKGDDDMHFRGAKFSGTANQKRDICPFVHKMYEAMIEPVLYRLDLEECRRQMDAHMKRLLDREVCYDDLVITRSIKSSYKLPACRTWRAVPTDEALEDKFCTPVECKSEAGLRGLCRELLRGGVHGGGRLVFNRAEFQAFRIVELRTNSVLALPADASSLRVAWGERGYSVVKPERSAAKRIFMPAEDANLAQVRVCAKQNARVSGSAVKSGRMSIIFVEPETTTDRGAATNDLAEDADYVKEKKLKANNEFYIDKQVSTPCGSILKLFMSEKEADAVFRGFAVVASQRRRGVVRLDQMAGVTRKRSVATVVTVGKGGGGEESVLQRDEGGPAGKQARGAASKSAAASSTRGGGGLAKWVRRAPRADGSSSVGGGV
jgi:DNA polymerase elongation subunit (family B)